MIHNHKEAVLIFRSNNKFALFQYQLNEQPILDVSREAILPDKDSDSSILAVARHIVTKISRGFGPIQADQILQGTIDSNDWCSTWMDLNYNWWSENLSEAHFYEEEKGQEQIIYFIQEIEDENQFRTQLEKLNVKFQLLTQQEIVSNKSITEKTRELFKDENRLNQILKKHKPTQRVIFVLNSVSNGQEIYENLKKNYPRMPTKGLYFGIFRQNYQEWQTFYSTDMTVQLPSDELLKSAHILVMPGSSASIYEDLPWIKRYKEWLSHVYYNHKHLRILGICFGEQALAEALGGRCIKVPERLKNPGYYNVKIDPLTFQDSFYNLPYVKCLNLEKKVYYISKAHGDIADIIDENKLSVLGSSPKYIIEVFGNNEQKSENPKILCIQGHPEYAGEWALLKNSQFFHLFTKKPLADILKKATAEYNQSHPDDYKEIRQICKSFMTFKE